MRIRFVIIVTTNLHIMPTSKAATRKFSVLFFVVLILLGLTYFFAPQGVLGASFRAWFGYVTRAEFAHVIVQNSDYEPLECELDLYDDLPADHEYCAAVNALLEAELIESRTPGSFGTDDTLSRAEAAKITHKTFELEYVTPDEPTFPDVEVDSWYYDFVEGLHAEDIIKIEAGSEFMPTNSLRRGALRYWMDHI